MGSKSVLYDVEIIQQFAGRLYSQAASVIFTSTFLGIIVGALIGAGATVATHSADIGIAALIGAIVGGLVGFSRGQERAFKLKLEAQQALCLVQIEKNTSSAQSIQRRPG